MHRTQIYFEESMFEELKSQSRLLNISLSAYIRELVKKDLKEKEEIKLPMDFSNFSGMWKDRDITQKSLREQAWK